MEKTDIHQEAGRVCRRIEGAKAEENAIDSFFTGFTRSWRTKIIATGGTLKKDKRREKAIVAP